MHAVLVPLTEMTEGAEIGDRYVVDAVLGEGGMASVYRVRDRKTGAVLALKRPRLLETKNASELRRMFEREFHTLSQLAHPRIIQVMDYGVDADGPYYTMELLDGADLNKDGRQPWKRACFVMRDVAAALAILHSRKLVHRDVSARNVRCTSDGRVKLFDFGAMAPMGVSKQIVGTSVYLPPEALQGLTLDGRSDLYSLGVLGYWMLTERYPYPGREFAELRRLWSEPVVPPHALTPHVPAALSELIMQLISLDPIGRPSIAAEVIERLEVIAGLERENEQTLAHAYLATPMLVGRDELTSKAREKLSFINGGCTLVISGEAGSGRTRALDVCVLEARLAGAVVVRADATDAGSGEYGVARALAEQLLEVLPEEARRAAALAGGVLEALSTESQAPRAVDLANRRPLRNALRDWIVLLTKKHKIVFAIDDVDRIDEASAGFLAMMAREVEHRPVALVLTRREGTVEMYALELIEQSATQLQVEAFTADDTSQLVRSVFGDVPHVQTLAQRVYDLVRGKPRDTMEMLDQLVARGNARYEAGAWQLPEDLSEAVLPSSSERRFETILAGLTSQDALELACALAIADPTAIVFEQYAALTSHRDPRRTHGAAMTLTDSGILTIKGAGYAFTQGAFRAWLEPRIDPAQKRELHRRAAKIFGLSGEAVRRLRHLIEASCERQAIGELIEDIGAESLPPTLTTLRLLERATEAAENLALPDSDWLTLALRAVGIAGFLSEPEIFKSLAPRVLERLIRDAGLADWLELENQVPEAERLTTALKRAQQRYDSTPHHKRGFELVESIRRLARLCSHFSVMTFVSNDAELIRQVPSLKMFAALSPLIEAMEAVVDSCRSGVAGRFDEVREILLKLVNRDAPEGKLAESFQRLKLAGLSIVAGMDAELGLPSTLTYAEQLDGTPGFRISAALVRAAYHRMHGRVGKAKEYQSAAELLQLQDGPVPLAGVGVRADLIACWLSDDLFGLKRIAGNLERQVAKFPHLTPQYLMALGHHQRLCGEPEKALASFDRALATSMGTMRDWSLIVASRVQVLTVLGRAEEAIEFAYDSIMVCERDGLGTPLTYLELCLVRALLTAGRTKDARNAIEHLLARQTKRGVEGVFMFRCHELRARVALAQGDREALSVDATRCAQLLASTDSTALRLLNERLRSEITGVHGGAPETVPLSGSRVDPGGTGAMMGTMRRMLRECTDIQQRARYALMALLDHAGVEAGHLYAFRGGAPCALVAIPKDEPRPEIDALVERYAAALISNDDDASLETVTGEGESAEHAAIRAIGLEPFTLQCAHSGERVLAGVVLVARVEGRTCDLPMAVCKTIALELIERQDTDPLVYH